MFGSCHCRERQTTGANVVAYYEDYSVKGQIREGLRKL
jgi:hypothetical protein